MATTNPDENGDGTRDFLSMIIDDGFIDVFALISEGNRLK